MSNELAKKLRLANAMRALILNAPEGHIDLLSPFPDGIVISQSKEGDHVYDFVLLYVRSVAELKEWGAQAVQAVTEDGLLWFSYPKQKSKIKTDINRDTGWSSIAQAGYEGVASISIDDTWSALRFRPANLVKTTSAERAARRESAVKPAGGERILEIPDDLAEAFKESPAAASFFETLSYTNRKEYVRWITDAKREETRSGRVVKTVDKLERGIKNPIIKE